MNKGIQKIVKDLNKEFGLNLSYYEDHYSQEVRLGRIVLYNDVFMDGVEFDETAITEMMYDILHERNGEINQALMKVGAKLNMY